MWCLIHKLVVMGICTSLVTGVQGQHAGDMVIGSSSVGGGALRIRYDFSVPIRVVPAFQAGGIVLYTATNPGFDALLRDEPQEGLYALAAGIQVRLELGRTDSGASIKIGGNTLDQPGESVTLGSMPNLHVHPEWRAMLREGVGGPLRLAVKLTTPSRRYRESAAYDVVLEPSVAQTPTAAPSPSSTSVSTRTPSPTTTASGTVTRTSSPTPSLTPTPVRTPTPSASASGSPTPRLPTLSPRPSPPGDINCDGYWTVADLVAAVCSKVDPPLCSPCGSGSSWPPQVDDAELVRWLFELGSRD